MRTVHTTREVRPHVPCVLYDVYNSKINRRPTEIAALAVNEGGIVGTQAYVNINA